MTDKLAGFKAAQAAIKKRKLHIHQVKLDASKPTPALATGNPFADYVIGGKSCPGFPRGLFCHRGQPRCRRRLDRRVT